MKRVMLLPLPCNPVAQTASVQSVGNMDMVKQHAENCVADPNMTDMEEKTGTDDMGGEDR